MIERDAANERETAEAAARAGDQGLLFTDDLAVMPEGTGFRGPTACSAAGITYRQLDYWARTKLVEPSVRLDRVGPAYGHADRSR